MSDSNENNQAAFSFAVHSSGKIDLTSASANDGGTALPHGEPDHTWSNHHYPLSPLCAPDGASTLIFFWLKPIDKYC